MTRVERKFLFRRVGRKFFPTKNIFQTIVEICEFIKIINANFELISKFDECEILPVELCAMCAMIFHHTRN